MVMKKQEIEITATVIAEILRKSGWTVEDDFAAVWSETAAGYETYGLRDKLWTTFIRENNDYDRAYLRVRSAVKRKLDSRIKRETEKGQ
jgi:hypothetical protein